MTARLSDGLVVSHKYCKNDIKRGDMVRIDREGTIYKPTVDDVKNKEYYELYIYIVTDVIDGKTKHNEEVKDDE